MIPEGLRTLAIKDTAGPRPERKRFSATPLQIIAVVIIITLATTTYLTYAENQALNTNLNGLYRSYNQFVQSYIQLQQELGNQTIHTQDQSTLLNYWNQLLNTLRQYSSPNSPQPPISITLALRIAIDYGGWNATSLVDKSVYVSLDLMSFEPYGPGPGPWNFQYLSEVHAPVANYSSYQVGNVTYHYVWFVSILTVPPGIPGYFYWVDAATGQVLNYPIIVF